MGNGIDLLVIRHGQTVWGSKGIIQGQFDSPLTELGRYQSAQVALLVKNIDIIVSSDLQRAVETARIISSVFKKNNFLEELSFFRERNFGILQGKNKDDVSLHLPDYESFGIEPESAFIFRIKKGLSYLRKKYPKQSIALVTHGGVIRWMHAHSQGIRLSDTYNLNIGNTSVHKF